MTIVIHEEPVVIAHGIKRKEPGKWRAVLNPLKDTIKPWQCAAAALRYPDDHEYNIIEAGSINQSPVFVDSHKQITFFFHDNCVVFIVQIDGVYHIKLFKCTGHKKGEGALLLTFAFMYIRKTQLRGTDAQIVLEPDYSMSEPGQHNGSPEERNRKLIAYYAKLGFAPIDAAKASATYGIKEFNDVKPPMENTVDVLLKKLTGAEGGKTRKLRYSSRTRRSRR